MSERLDLRTYFSVLRRHRLVLALAVLLGAVGGLIWALARPPLYTSTSIVLLAAMPAGSSATQLDTGTQVWVARSSAVLDPVSSALTPPLSTDDLLKQLEVDSPADGIIQITARAGNADEAVSLSGDVASSFVDVENTTASSLPGSVLSDLQGRATTLRQQFNAVQQEIETTTARQATESPTSPNGVRDAQLLAGLRTNQSEIALQLDKLQQQITDARELGHGLGNGATVIQTAPAQRASVVTYTVLCIVASALALLAVALVGLAIRARRDRRIYTRADFATALGADVLGSIRTQAGRSTSAWSSLLDTYEPGAVEAWTIRQILRDLADARSREAASVPHPRSLTVVGLTADAKAAALACQIASFAASVGIKTALILPRREGVPTALWFACAAQQPAGARPLSLHTERSEVRAALRVVFAVLEPSAPDFTDLPRTGRTVLAVSPGSARADELASVAIAADDRQLRIDGVVVADPDPLDNTIGRVRPVDHPNVVSLPVRLTGPVESQRVGPHGRGDR